MTECSTEIFNKVIDIISSDLSKLKFVRISTNFNQEHIQPLECWDCWVNTELPVRKNLEARYQIDANRKLIFSFSDGFFGKHIYGTAKLRIITPKIGVFGKKSVEEIPVFTNINLVNSTLHKILLTEWQKVCKIVNDSENKHKEEECQTALKALSL